MASSFVIYIDESGDEGFNFKPGGAGSSVWFVLTAVIIRKEYDLAMVTDVRKSRERLGRGPTDTLHFKNLSHSHRLAWAQDVGKMRLRIASFLVHKPSIDPTDFQATPYLLYRYCTRLLIERCSWLCRDKAVAGRGDGVADLIFSNRSKMSYEELRAYLVKLSTDPKVKIDWRHIDPTRVRAVNHDQLAGLQVADCAASAHFKAVAPDPFGNAEPRYFSALSSRLYKNNCRIMSYGLKFWPDLTQIRPSNTHLSIFDGLK